MAVLARLLRARGCHIRSWHCHRALFPIFNSITIPHCVLTPFALRSQSLLLPIPVPPSSLPALARSLEDQFRPALAPTGHVLELVRESVQSGAQRELWGRVWEKALSDEPRKLLVVAWGRVMENFWGREEGEGSGSGPGAGTGAGKKDGK